MNDSVMNFLVPVVGFLLAFLVAFAIVTHIQLELLRRKTEKNPTEENARRMYRILCRPGVSIKNHPKDWAKYKNMFYRVNGSNQVPTPLKELIKKRLVRKGLLIDNMRIIDNYGKSPRQ